MLENILNKLNTRGIWRAGALLAFFTLFAKLTGLWRDRVLASMFGASGTLDIYYSAFKIPDFIFNLLVLGAASAAIIPVFLENRAVSERKGWQVASSVATAGFYAVLAVSGLVFLFAEQFAVLVAPGITGADRVVLVQLMRIMLFSPIIFSISAVLGAVLQALERFLAYALAPIFYNLGIIVGAVYIVPHELRYGGEAAYGLGLGVILGALLHLAVQAVPAVAAGFRFRLTFDPNDPGLRKIIRLMMPRTLALGTYSVGVTIINAFASALGTGAITVLNLATNLQFLPVSILGISVATAAFPRLSVHASKGERELFREQFREAMRSTAGLVSVLALAIFLFRRQIVSLLFGLGAFGGADVDQTAMLLGIFMFSVTAQSLMHVITRAYYALQNTRTPFYVALGAIFLMVAVSYLFAFTLGWGVTGLAVAHAVAYNVNFLFLYFLFLKQYFRTAAA